MSDTRTTPAAIAFGIGSEDEPRHKPTFRQPSEPGFAVCRVCQRYITLDQWISEPCPGSKEAA